MSGSTPSMRDAAGGLVGQRLAHLLLQAVAVGAEGGQAGDVPGEEEGGTVLIAAEMGLAQPGRAPQPRPRPGGPEPRPAPAWRPRPPPPAAGRPSRSIAGRRSAAAPPRPRRRGGGRGRSAAASAPGPRPPDRRSGARSAPSPRPRSPACSGRLPGDPTDRTDRSDRPGGPLLHHGAHPPRRLGREVGIEPVAHHQAPRRGVRHQLVGEDGERQPAPRPWPPPPPAPAGPAGSGRRRAGAGRWRGRGSNPGPRSVLRSRASTGVTVSEKRSEAASEATMANAWAPKKARASPWR